MIIDRERDTPVIKPNKGLGGLGGRYLKPIALANVKTFYELLGPEFPIIGVGGIETGRDVYDYILCGASAVEIGTQFAKEGPGCFERIQREFEEIMERKGYSSIEELRGKLELL